MTLSEMLLNVYKMLFWKFMKELLCFVTKFDNIDELVFLYRKWHGKLLKIRSASQLVVNLPAEQVTYFYKITNASSSRYYSYITD